MPAMKEGGGWSWRSCRNGTSSNRNDEEGDEGDGCSAAAEAAAAAAPMIDDVEDATAGTEDRLGLEEQKVKNKEKTRY